MLNYLRNLLWPKQEEEVMSVEIPDVKVEYITVLEEESNDYMEIDYWNGKPTVSIDFDGVIHSYTSGWQGADNIPDEPVFKIIPRTKKRYTSIDWLTELVNADTMNIAIFSSRNNQDGGIKAMQAYLLFHGMKYETLMKISFPEHKPPSHVMVDDRCLRFTGEFFSADQLINFKTWQNAGI